MNKIMATPKAKAYAQNHGIRLELIRGSGEHGSILYRDVLGVKSQKKMTSVAKMMADYYQLDYNTIQTDKKWIKKNDVLKYTNMADISLLTSKRKTIANNILQSINNSAQYTLFAELDTTKMMSFYQAQKNSFASMSQRLTFTDMLIAVVSRTLMIHKKMNASLIGDKLYQYNYVNLSLAVAADDGLVAPVIHGTNMMDLAQILSAREDIVTRTKNKTLIPDDFNGGTFTLSNLGNSQITYFTPIINYPQSAILGVGKTEDKPVVVNSEIVIQSRTYFSLTLDHLILDGKDGADFYDVMQAVLNSPESYIE